MTLKSLTGTLLSFFLWCQSGQAQMISRATVGMAGSSHALQTRDHVYFISQSIGQASVIGTFGHNGKVVRQGFQQPPGNLLIKTIETAGLNATIYPNPTSGWLNIKVKDQSITEIGLHLIDNTGRLLHEAQYNTAQPITFDLSTFSSGVYTLKLVGKHSLLLTSVIKQ